MAFGGETGSIELGNHGVAVFEGRRRDRVEVLEVVVVVVVVVLVVVVVVVVVVGAWVMVGE